MSGEEKNNNNESPVLEYNLVNKETGKGGRQGERVYSINSCGPTICASSGGPGARTGLYKIPIDSAIPLERNCKLLRSHPSDRGGSAESQDTQDAGAIPDRPAGNKDGITKFATDRSWHGKGSVILGGNETIRIRRLSISESLQMFGFNKDYKYETLKNKNKMLYFLGNSIVVNVLEQLIEDL